MSTRQNELNIAKRNHISFSRDSLQSKQRGFGSRIQDTLDGRAMFRTSLRLVCDTRLSSSQQMTKHVGSNICRPLTSGNRCETTSSTTRPRILITGSLGQLGPGLASALRMKYGQNNVIMSDIMGAPKEVIDSGPFMFADIADFNSLEEIILNERISWLIHFAAIVSARGEQDMALAKRVNIQGVHNVLELTRQHDLKLFIPSTIGAFGPTSPRNPAPDLCIQRPKTFYGVSKVYAELLGEYYNHRFGVDFRCLRFPGVISNFTGPTSGGTSGYATDIFHAALDKGHYECYLREDTRMPMIYIDDLSRAVVELMEAPAEKLKLRTYNVTAMSFTLRELYEAICKHIPNFTMSCKPDFRQQIADSWPMAFDDSGARGDWGWKHEFGLEQVVQIMLEKLKQTDK